MVASGICVVGLGDWFLHFAWTLKEVVENSAKSDGGCIRTSKNIGGQVYVADRNLLRIE